MNWVTVAISMIASACLVLALVHGLVWARHRDAVVSLWFSLLAASTAAMAMIELWMLQAGTIAEYGTALRLFHIPVLTGVIALVLFVRQYLGPAHAWIGWVACGMRAVSLVINFSTTPNINYVQITSLVKVSFLGQSVNIANGVPNPWLALAQLSLVILQVYVITATVTAWRRRARTGVLAVGSALIFFIAAGTLQAVLSFWGFIHVPYFSAPFFVGAVVVAGFDLGFNYLRAEQLERDLEVKDVQLHKSEEWLNLAANAASAGLWNLETWTGRVWATPKTLEMFSLQPGHDYLAEDFVAAAHPDDRDILRQTIEELALTGRDVHVEFRIVRPTGEIRWYESYGKVHRNDNGGSGHVTGVTLDITDRKARADAATRQRAELASLERTASMNELSVTLAHEINQPLAIILSNAQAAQRLLEHARPDLGEVGDILRDIVREDQRAADVIKHLRNLFEQGAPNRQPLELKDTITNVVELVRDDLIASQVRVRLELADDLPSVRADRILIEQILLNLITNSRDAMADNAPDDRLITISTGHHERWVRVSVRDTGRGLPVDADRIFTPFFTTKTHHFGMGLAMCRSIATAHEGSLTAEPAPDRGAVLHLMLPVEVPPA